MRVLARRTDVGGAHFFLSIGQHRMFAHLYWLVRAHIQSTIDRDEEAKHIKSRNR